MTYAIVMSALATIRWRIWSFGADTGTFTQIALNAFRGFYDTSELGSHFHVHWAPLLATLYPFAMLTHSGLAIQIAQTVLVGLGIFPFFALVRRYVDTRPASTLAGLTLLYPPLLAVAFDEFHEIAFYPVIVFALLWAIDAGRWPWAWAFALLSLGVREEALLVDAVFGVLLVAASLRRSGGSPRGVLFFEPREPRPTLALGLGLAIFGPAVFAIYFAVVAPALGGWTASHFYDYPFARGPLRLIEAIFTRPFDVARAIATPGRATYLLEAFAPVLFIGLRSRWMFVVIPGLAIVTLSSDAIAWRMGTHYAGLWAPWLLVATAHAIVRIARSPSGARSARRISRAILTCYAIVLIAFDPLHPGHYLRAPYGDLGSARAAFASIPRDASVYTHDEWFAHFAGTRPAAEHIWNAPAYVVLAADFPNAGTFAPFMRRETTHGCYAIVRRFRAVTVYEREPEAMRAARCRIPRGDRRAAAAEINR